MTPDPWSALWLSILVGIWCVVLGFPLAAGAGWLLARKHFPGKALLGTLLLAPLVAPPVVTGYVLLRLLGRHSLLGNGLDKLGIQIPFTTTGAVLAALVVGLPLFVLSARSAFESVDPRFELLAQSLGDSRWQAFRRVVLPLAMPGLSAGAVLAFARALGEFGATAVLSGNIEGQTRTLSMAVYTLLDAPNGEGAASILVLISLGLSFASLLGYEALNRWQRRRLEVSHG